MKPPAQKRRRSHQFSMVLRTCSRLRAQSWDPVQICADGKPGGNFGWQSRLIRWTASSSLRAGTSATSCKTAGSVQSISHLELHIGSGRWMGTEISKAIWIRTNTPNRSNRIIIITVIVYKCQNNHLNHPAGFGTAKHTLQAQHQLIPNTCKIESKEIWTVGCVNNQCHLTHLTLNHQ